MAFLSADTLRFTVFLTSGLVMSASPYALDSFTLTDAAVESCPGTPSRSLSRYSASRSVTVMFS